MTRQRTPKPLQPDDRLAVKLNDHLRKFNQRLVQSQTPQELGQYGRWRVIGLSDGFPVERDVDIAATAVSMGLLRRAAS